MGSRIGSFLVKSPYHALGPDDPLEFPRSIIWRSCVPPKVAFNIFFFCMGSHLEENPNFGLGPKEWVFIGE